MSEWDPVVRAMGERYLNTRSDKTPYRTGRTRPDHISAMEITEIA